MVNPETRLSAFQAENNIFTKGPLSLVIQFTRLVRDQTFPLNPDNCIRILSPHLRWGTRWSRSFA